MNRFIKMLLLLGLLVMFFWAETMMKQDINLVEVQVLTRNMQEGDLVQEADVRWIKIPEATDEIKPVDGIGKYLRYALPQKSLLQGEMLMDEKISIMEEGERVITVKCTVVEANGWYADYMDFVDIVMVASEGSTIIEDARIISRFSEVEDAEDRYAYYSMIVKVSDALEYYENLRNSDVYISIKQER